MIIISSTIIIFTALSITNRVLKPVNSLLVLIELFLMSHIDENKIYKNYFKDLNKAFSEFIEKYDGLSKENGDALKDVIHQAKDVADQENKSSVNSQIIVNRTNQMMFMCKQQKNDAINMHELSKYTKTDFKKLISQNEKILELNTEVIQQLDMIVETLNTECDFETYKKLSAEVVIDIKAICTKIQRVYYHSNKLSELGINVNNNFEEVYAILKDIVENNKTIDADTFELSKLLQYQNLNIKKNNVKLQYLITTLNSVKSSIDKLL